MPDERRPILEHLEEFRKRVIFSLVWVILLSALSYIFAESLLWHLARYVGELVFISPPEAFLAHIKVAVFSGALLSSPVIIFNALRFVWVALKKSEKKAFMLYLAAGLALFLSGALFSYFIALPAAMRFFLAFSSDFLRPYISVSQYISFAAFLVLAFALAFETPLFIIVLARAGVINSDLLSRKRKYIIVLIFVVAALLTPPDVITQILLAVPLLILYEISVICARVTEKKKD